MKSSKRPFGFGGLAPLMTVAARSLGIGMLLLASACGGGGGGGGFVPTSASSGGTAPPASSNAPPGSTTTPPAQTGSVKVSFDTSALTMSYQMGDTAPAGAVVNVSASGDGANTLFMIASSDPNIQGIQPVVSGMSARVLVVPKAGLAAGVYKGSLSLQACPDAACSANYAGSPWTLDYTLTVTAAYATLDTSAYGMPRTMVYDALRGDIYASYPATYGLVGISAIAKFHWNGSAWTSSTLSMPGLLDIALSTDGSVLAATDLSKHVNLIDPTSFSLTHSHLSTTGLGDGGTSTEVGIAFTNDGKLWTPTGTGGWGGLGYFDLKTLSFGVSNPRCSECYQASYLAVSGDGSRLMFTQSAAISPAPPMLYMDSVDDVFHINPIGLQFFYFLTSLSYNGDRFLMQGHTVYDRAFGTVGNLPQPPSGVRAAQMSPDGRRAYMLSYAVEPGDSNAPSVQVFDTSAQAGTQINLPMVGSFTIPDLPGCQTSSYPYYECYRPRMRITPDGNSLIILGDRKLIVTPIPKVLSGVTQ